MNPYGIGLACILLLLSLAANAAPRDLVFSHVVDPDTPKGRMAEMFKSIVERKMGDRFNVVIHPNASLMDDGEAVAAVARGDIHFAAPSLSKFDTYTSKLKVFDLPFLFSDMDAVERFQNGPQGQALLNSMKAQGITGLGYLHNGMKQLSADRAFRLPSDLKGASFRIMDSEVLERQFEIIGAIPVPMAFADVYSALEKDLIQGQENTWSNIFAGRFYEHQSHIMESNHGVLGYMVITNKAFLDSLEESEQRHLRFAMKMALKYGNAVAIAKSLNDRDELVRMKSVTVFKPTEEEVRVWRNQMKPIWEEYESVLGKELIEAAYNSES